MVLSSISYLRNWFLHCFHFCILLALYELRHCFVFVVDDASDYGHILPTVEVDDDDVMEDDSISYDLNADYHGATTRRSLRFEVMTIS